MNEQDIINVLFMVYSLVIALMLWRAKIKIQIERKKREYFDKKMKDLKPMFGELVE